MLLEPLEKLIIEHGSATIQSKHIALLREQLAILDNKFLLLTSENEVLKTENEKLKSKNHTLVTENKILRQKIQKYEHPHSLLLDKEKTDILLYLLNHIGDTLTFQIVKSLNMSEDIAEYHLKDLYKKEFIREGLPILPGQHSWSIDDKGKRYLIKNKLIS